MPKMTKAQAKRRLKEALVKIGMVHWNSSTGQIGGDPISSRDDRKLFDVMDDLKKIISKWK